MLTDAQKDLLRDAMIEGFFSETPKGAPASARPGLTKAILTTVASLTEDQIKAKLKEYVDKKKVDSQKAIDANTAAYNTRKAALDAQLAKFVAITF